MPTEKKREIVEELAYLLGRSTIAIMTDYRGLSANEMNQLRRQIKETGGEFRVVKNTLARFAAEQVGKTGLAEILVGPTAIAFGYEADVSTPVKTIVEYVRASRQRLTIKGAAVDGRVLDALEVAQLATLPPKDVIIGQVLGAMQAPIAALLGVLSAPQRSLLGVLQARLEQLQEKS